MYLSWTNRWDFFQTQEPVHLHSCIPSMSMLYSHISLHCLTYFFFLQISGPHCLTKLEVPLIFNSNLIIFRQFIFSFVRFGNTSSNTTLNKHYGNKRGFDAYMYNLKTRYSNGRLITKK